MTVDSDLLAKREDFLRLMAVVNRLTILNGHIIGSLKALTDGDVAAAKSQLEISARGAEEARELFEKLGELLRHERYNQPE
jgi:hypothetical protein